MLTRLLFNRHRVRIGATAGDLEKSGAKGSAWFAAFDPWNTCWRPPPGSFSFFDLAERKGIISPDDARLLSNALLLHGESISKVYRGYFSYYFREPRIQFVLRHASEPEHLSDIGLSIASSAVDYLAEKCPWPFIPEQQLIIRGFRGVPATDDSQFYVRSPWLTWAMCLDMVSLGPLAGVSPAEILHVVDSMSRFVRHEVAEISLSDRSLGQRITIPFFSGGLQGSVFGLFHDISDDQKDAIHTTLLEFGQTLADTYAEMRLSRLAALLGTQLGLEELAKEAVCAFSPVNKLVVETKQGRAGFKLCHEENYWAGYLPLSREEAQDRSAAAWFTIKASSAVDIHIEPLIDIPYLDPDFFQLRLESGFRRIFAPRDGIAVADSLSLHEVQQRLRELATYIDDGKPSFAKMRQYFVAQQVERDLQLCGTRITNVRLKGFLEEKTGARVKNGYQISSYQGEVERVFPNKLKVEKTRYGVSLSWKVAP